MKQFLSLIIILFTTFITVESCSKTDSTVSAPQAPAPPAVPKPTITFDGPTNVSYGELVIISYTTTGANGLKGTIEFARTADTTVSLTVSGPGGSTTATHTVKVAGPTDRDLALVALTWKETEQWIVRSAGDTIPNLNFLDCQKKTSHKFELDLFVKSSAECYSGPNPEGYGRAKWYWLDNKERLSWGSGEGPNSTKNFFKMTSIDPIKGFSLFLRQKNNGPGPDSMTLIRKFVKM